MCLTLIKSAVFVMCAAPAMAASVHEQQYGYKYGDTVRAMPDDTFLVCVNCGPDKLAKALRQPVVAIRLSQGEPLQVQADQMVQEPPAGQSAKADLESDKGCNASDCLLGTVRFNFDSDKIKHSEKKKLKHLAAIIPSGRKVTVTGYTCTIGKKGYNKALSKRRAQKIADYLKHEGKQVAKVEGKGDINPVSSDKRLNRRVEIIEKGKN